MQANRLAAILSSGKRFAPPFVQASGGTTYTAGPVLDSVGITSAWWTEYASEKASFGDPNTNAQTLVDAIPTTGAVISAGADINAALSSSNVVILLGGTYTTGGRITVPAGKKLIGAAGQTITLACQGSDIGVITQHNAVLANVIVADAQLQGVKLYTSAGDTGSTGCLIYQVSVRRTGLNFASGTTGAGIFVSQNAANNTIVTCEAFDTWNELATDGTTSGVTAHGGNADGVNNSWGAFNNSFIDVHSYRNGDDGFDMWNGGQSYWYFSAAHDGGKPTGKSLHGDGNGIKLGIGAVAHKFYKCFANDNVANGFDINGNTVQPVLVSCGATGNGGLNFAGIP